MVYMLIYFRYFVVRMKNIYCQIYMYPTINEYYNEQDSRTN